MQWRILEWILEQKTNISRKWEIQVTSVRGKGRLIFHFDHMQWSCKVLTLGKQDVENKGIVYDL